MLHTYLQVVSVRSMLSSDVVNPNITVLSTLSDSQNVSLSQVINLHLHLLSCRAELCSIHPKKERELSACTVRQVTGSYCVYQATEIGRGTVVMDHNRLIKIILG